MEKKICREHLNLFLIAPETCLLRKLLVQTLPHATPPIGKINPFSKMAITFEPLMGFLCPSGFIKVLITMIQSIL